jgi:hypothetical protein
LLCISVPGPWTAKATYTPTADSPFLIEGDRWSTLKS